MNHQAIRINLRFPIILDDDIVETVTVRHMSDMAINVLNKRYSSQMYAMQMSAFMK